MPESDLTALSFTLVSPLLLGPEVNDSVSSTKQKVSRKTKVLVIGGTLTDYQGHQNNYILISIQECVFM